MTEIVPYTFDGHVINGLNAENSVTYTAVLDKPYGLPPINPVRIARQGRWSVLTSINRDQRILTPLAIAIDDGDFQTAVVDLHLWFSPEDETPKQFVVRDADSGRPRYVEAICRSLDQMPQTAGRAFVALLEIHDDVRFRATVEDSQVWSITSTGQTVNVNNQGEDDAYPTLTITPTGAKTGGFGYKQWMPVDWIFNGAETNYPTDIAGAALNTAALVSGGKMQADGDDLRVYLNGAEIPRWLGNMNTSTTRIWCSLDWSTNQTTPLKTAIGPGDTVLTIDADSDISGFPSSGVLLINGEAFTYTDKNDSINRFLGVTRAMRETAAGNHSVNDTIKWIQNDIWIVYGNSTIGAPSYDTTNGRPVFDVDASTNDLWSYEDTWGSDGETYWSKQWVLGGETVDSGMYGTYIELYPYEDFSDITTTARLTNALGIVRSNFIDATKLVESSTGGWIGYVKTTNGTEYNIPAPTVANTEQSWSTDEIFSSSSWVEVECTTSQRYGYIRLKDVDIYLNTSNTPNSLATFTEVGNYDLESTITNQETGDAITLKFNMELNEDMIIDTKAKTVEYSADNSSQFQALSLNNTRRDWLPLKPGVNTLRFDDPGTNNVTIIVKHRKRYFF